MLNYRESIKSSIRQAIKEKKKAIARKNKLEKIYRVIDKPSTQEAIRLMYIESWITLNLYPNDMNHMCVSYIDAEGNVLLNNHYDYDRWNADYDEVVGVATGFGVENSLVQEVNIERVIEGVTFRIFAQREAKIPKEDLQLLKRLGKIKTNFHEAYISESIFCEFG